MIVGDTFTSRSCRHYFVNGESKAAKESFARLNFEIKVATGNGFVSTNPSALGRFCNYVIHLINNNYLLPKYIVMVMDYDLLEDIKFNQYGILVLLGKLCEWLVSEVH